MSTSSPTYIYKILPSSPPPPSPLPLSLPVSALDSRDNFIHASTSVQVLGTLNKFYLSQHLVYILRIPYSRVEAFVKWEDVNGKSMDAVMGPWDMPEKKGFFPHIYGNGLRVGREEVDQVGVWEKLEGYQGWDAKGWPFGEVDRPPEA